MNSSIDEIFKSLGGNQLKMDVVGEVSMLSVLGFGGIEIASRA